MKKITSEDERTKIRVYQREYDAKHESSRKYWFQRKYGVSLMERDNMIQNQDNTCKICKAQFDNTRNSKSWNRPCIDHNHTTGQVRAVLCNNCNNLLGYADENIETLQAAITYLQNYLIPV